MRPCRFEGCERTDIIRRGPYRWYCKGHWQQLRNRRPLTPLKKIRKRGACLERNENGHKLCIRCEEWLPESDFSKVPQSLDGFNSRCSFCNILDKYSLTKTRYREILAAQDGGCAICLG